MKTLEHLLNGLVVEQLPPQTATVRQVHIAPLVVALVRVQVGREHHSGNPRLLTQLLWREGGPLGSQVVKLAQKHPVIRVIAAVREQPTLHYVMSVEPRG